jgi:hypothetical protein
VRLRDSRCHVEHDDCALTLNVVAIAQTAKFLLPGRVPYIESDWSPVGVEKKRVDLHTKGR